MERYELIAPCHFGLEAVLKKEVVDLGYEVTEVENGRVTFIGDAEAICRANIFLRTAERVLLKVGSFKAVTFDELFEATRAIPWEKYLPKDGKCWVKKASSISSKLFSPSDIQKIMKKAIARHMQEYYDGCRRRAMNIRCASFSIRIRSQSVSIRAASRCTSAVTVR